MPPHQMTKEDASRIQSGTAKNGGDMSSGGWAAKAQSLGDRNDNASGNGNGGTKPEGGAGADGKK